jgi:UDP-N-acetylmuramate dehydrogenase|tara:strand:+ start:25071 stop:26087 length:1017 start_codon:yes stop_codon:yes gene_type:complete
LGIINLLFHENFSLATHNTLGLDIRARYFCSAENLQDLSEVLAFARDGKLEILVLGGGSNVVFSGDFDGLVLRIDFQGMEFDDQKVVVGAGVNWHRLVQHSLERELFGLENLSLIPGLAGAAPIQNIGAYGQELDGVFVALAATDLSTGEELVLTRSDCHFGYRNSIFKGELKDRVAITQITLQLSSDFLPILEYQELVNELERRKIDLPTALDISDAVVAIRKHKLPDPSVVGNAGSFYKNPELSSQTLANLRHSCPNVPSHKTEQGLHKVPAAWLIEQAGMKGESVGDALVSTQHALVIVNKGNARCHDVLALAAKIEQQVQSQFGVLLEMEPVLY